MTVTTTITTAQQLIAAGDIGRCELVRGELITMSPAGTRHGKIGMRLAIKIGGYIDEHRLGESYLAESGFILARNPDTVRAPDFAFNTHGTLMAKPDPERGFREGSPDLAMEVVSPDDSASDMLGKVFDWLDGGAKLVLVVDPRSRTITAYHPDRTARVFTVNDELDLEPVVPGFSLSVGVVFGGAESK